MSEDEQRHDEHDPTVLLPTETVEETVRRRERHQTITVEVAMETFRRIMQGELKR